MPPQTRNAAKPSPGRSTRNSLYGRPPPSPAKPRKSATTTHDLEAEGKAAQTDTDTKTTPWLSCRDAHGVLTSIAMSETGEGIHIRWYYPEDDYDVDEDEDAQDQMRVDDERDVTPPATAGPSNGARRPFPQTPMPLHPFDAGSVIRTPVKKAKPLQRSPPRIGDQGIRCLYEKEGVLRELNGGVRVVLRHPVGSSANLTREQVERMEDEREEQIFLVQVKRLLEQKKRLEEEEARFASRYEDGMEMDDEHDLEREKTTGTTLISRGGSSSIVPTTSVEEIERELGFTRGPNGELLDQHGRQMFGREGTILMDPTHGSPRRIRREEAFVMPTRARLGPHGTELLD